MNNLKTAWFIAAFFSENTDDDNLMSVADRIAGISLRLLMARCRSTADSDLRRFSCPLRELLERGLLQGVPGGFNLWSQCRSPFRRGRLHSNKNNFLRRSIHEAQCANQVREAKQMNTLRNRKILKVRTFKPLQRTRNSAGVHCIEHQEVRDVAKTLKQIEPKCPSFDNADFRRQPATLFELTQRKHPDSIIGSHEITEAQQCNPEWGVITHRLSFTGRLRGARPWFSASVTSSTRRWRTNFQPVKMLSISPFLSLIPTNKAL